MKIGRQTLAAALISLCALALASCTLFLNTLVYDKDTNLYTDKKTGVKYTDAPSRFEPTGFGEGYAKWKSAGENVVFSEIEGMDPLLWLAEEGKTVFYAEGVALPTLSEFAPYGIYVCYEDVYTVALAEITDAGDIGEVVGRWESGEAVAYPGVEPEATYRIKFLSEEYPGLYYNLIYVRYAGGATYLYSRDSGRCVAAGDVIGSYISG